MLIDDVAALYVDPLGPYPKLCAHWYDETKDARTYDGPWPVVAHPPCGPWGKLRHEYRGAEHDCAPRALQQVRAFGGVLEHPEGSMFWPTMHLPEPGQRDAFGGFTLEVEQVAWGHVARKRTWLYFFGSPFELVRDIVRTGGTPTHWVSGGRNPKGRRESDLVPPGIKVCSAQQRRRTPVSFALWLLSIARTSRQRSLTAC